MEQNQSKVGISTAGEYYNDESVFQTIINCWDQTDEEQNIISVWKSPPTDQNFIEKPSNFNLISSLSEWIQLPTDLPHLNKYAKQII
jgi:hypothetical protein